MSPLLLAALLACASRTVGTPATSAAAPTGPPVATPVAQRRPFPTAPDPTGRALGICYGPHRPGQRPGGPDPSPDQVAQDLELIAARWGMLRMYGSRGPARVVLETIAARELPLSVVVGAWIDDDDPAADQAEVDAAIALARDFPAQVVAVSVGNETQVGWSAHRSPPEALVAQIRRVRAAVDQPVTTADDYSYWVLPESRAVAAELDFLLVHAHPLWNGQPLPDGIPWLQATLDRVQATHPDLPMVLGEVGWATSHDPQAAEGAHIRGATGPTEQAAFYGQIEAWVDARALPTFWFEAFDEPWKGGDSPAEVEKHWGLFDADRQPKPALEWGQDVR